MRGAMDLKVAVGPALVVTDLTANALGKDLRWIAETFYRDFRNLPTLKCQYHFFSKLSPGPNNIASGHAFKYDKYTINAVQNIAIRATCLE